MPTPFQSVIDAIASSGIVAPDLAVRALGELRDGVITGEGPTARGRIHFSRSLDGEAEMLLQIDAAASERLDGGRFDDLLVKAVAHHALSSAGKPVPPRPVALSSATPLESWASQAAAADVDAEVRQWIADHIRQRRRSSKALMTIAVFFIGSGALSAMSTVSTLVDLLG
jgi:hypothetical protein